MSIHFQHPSFLWVLLALLLPILIHLFNFRRYRKVYFSNLKFLENLQAEHRSRSKLKHLLILLARLLTMAMLIVAFAQPYQPSKHHQPSKDRNKRGLTSIYIDNSFSMNAEEEKGKLFEVARDQAIQIVRTLPNTTRFQILSNSSAASHRLLNMEQAIVQIQELEPGTASRQLSDIVKQAQRISNPSEYTQNLYVFSDFQRSCTDLHNLVPDSSLQVVFLPIQASAENNLLIDSCWFSTPYHKLEQTEELSVRIRNTSAEGFREIPVKLSINDSLRAVASFNIEPRATQVVILKYNNKHKGLYKGKVEISDFPITYDNQLYFSYTIADKVNILAINGHQANFYVEKLFSNKDYFNYENTNVKSIGRHNISRQNLIILNQVDDLEAGLAKQISNFVSSGGNVLVLPSETNPRNLNSFLQEHSCPTIQSIDSSETRLARVELNASIYTKVFKNFREDARLPQLHQFYQLKQAVSGLSEIIWQGQGKIALLSRSPYGKGNIYLSAVPFSPEWSDLVTHPIFVPTLSNMALNHDGAADLYYTLGQTTSIHLPLEQLNDRYPLHLKNLELGVDIIPSQRNTIEKGLEVNFNNQLNQAGNYVLSRNDKAVHAIAFNYPRQESEQEFYSKEEIDGLIRNFQLFNCGTAKPEPENLIQKLEEQRQGKPYWKIFIVLSFLFFLSEALLQKYYK